MFKINWYTMIKYLSLIFLLFCLIVSTITSLTFSVSADPNVPNSWIEKTSMNQARSGLSTAVVNEKIYAIGGQVLVYQDSSRTESKVVGTNEEYDPYSDSWTEKASMPIPSSDFATAVYDNKIYCIGGGVTDVFNSSTGTWDTKITVGFNQVYDPATNTWENKTPAPLPQTSAQANVVNGKIYLVNGYPNRTLMQVYDPLTDKWGETLQIPFSGVTTSGVLDGQLYFFGDSLTVIYNPNTETWRDGRSPLDVFFKGDLGVTTGIVAPKMLYIFYNPFNAPNSSLYQTQAYNPTNDSWVTGASLPFQRQEFGVAVVNDVIYVIGGYTLSPPSIVDVAQNYLLTYSAVNEAYFPFEYGETPPYPIIIAPSNTTYNENTISLSYTLSQSASWMGYSLDGKGNVTITGNTTLTALTIGMHNITVYAEDANGIGASQTIHFVIADEKFSNSELVILTSVTAVVIVGAIFVIFVKKLKKH